ncbi:plasmid replication, integration and excision activator [Sphaerisporangium album]|uniref:plasmid replication, integration and excision activator n=1 Tax=Sphaerisporangium album TaxID=509200 RepID=UPI00319DECD2
MAYEVVFPFGCYVVGEVSPVLDFEASTKDRPVPARDKATGELMWAVPVMDGDTSLKAKAKAVSVKILSAVEPQIPAPPAEMAGLPFIPVVFEGLTVTPYVDQSNNRLAYSYKARGMRAAGATRPAKAG